MSQLIGRRAFLAASTATVLGAGLLGGCSSETRSSSSPSDGPYKITVGSLDLEDILPLWVAQEQGWLADFNLDIDVVIFQSATELIAGVGSGDVDMAMTDVMVAASMFAGGTDVQIEWITLGATPEQGRFGIMVGPDSDITSLEQLAGVPIGVGSNTILEYVMDGLLEEAGVPEDKIVVEELQKLPVRYQAMLSGEVAAAALPASLLALGEANGCKVIADDTTGKNLSTSVMIARTSFLESEDGSAALEAFKKVWNESATDINESPQAFHEVLVKNANLPESIAETYPVSDYPICELPSSQIVDPILAWMEKKGYLTQKLSYDQATGTFSFA